MEEVNVLVGSGKNRIYLKNDFIQTRQDSKMLIKNVAMYWNFQNIHKDNRDVTMIDDAGAKTVIQFPTGYWTFNMVSKRLKEDGIKLTKNRHNNSCRIICRTHSVELGNFGVLIGLEKNTTIPKGLLKDSDPVDVNLGLKYIRLGCDWDNTSKNFDTNGERNKTMATFAVPSDQSLNGTVSLYDKNYEVSITNRDHNSFNFHVDTNISDKEDVNVSILFDAYIK